MKKKISERNDFLQFSLNVYTIRTRNVMARVWNCHGFFLLFTYKSKYSKIFKQETNQANIFFWLNNHNHYSKLWRFVLRFTLEIYKNKKLLLLAFILSVSAWYNPNPLNYILIHLATLIHFLNLRIVIY